VKIKIQNIDDEHHVLRFLPSRVQHRDFETDELKGVHAAAFEPRERDKGALSVTWVEYFQSFTKANIAKAIAAFRASWRTDLDAPIFALGNVGKIKVACKEAGNPCRVVHEPTSNNKAHAAIRRLQAAEAVVFDQLAHDAFADVRDEHANVVCENPIMGYTPGG
jgi:hypothetical protein